MIEIIRARGSVRVYYSMRSKREFAKTNIQRSSRIVFRVGPDLDRAKDEPSTREKARAKRAY